ncbi:MAG: aldehyde ferredoxin oxidoreductase family protein [Phycisphaerales bacterium]|jgi:aldehyde:ferredoxin oxidoreductase|nr:aldehyde ferredoxin oxidoreductase family protein [Phycisphaerales bacterium]
MFGHHGEILKINLGSGDISREQFDEAFGRKFLGGNGLAAKLIYDNVPADADPLGPDNALVFAVGPVTDTPVWGSSRGHAAAISPQTGLFADSNFGGKFAVIQKRTGFDAIFINGCSDTPVYLLITEDGAEVKDAAWLWGKDTEAAIDALIEKEGSGAMAVAIGPAGENLIPFANILGGGRRPGSAGRAGMGAVMGSKNLKAIVVKGDKRTEMSDRDGLVSYLRGRLSVLQENGAALHNHGTPILVNIINGKGMLCTHNNARETFDRAEEISGEVMRQQYWDKDTTCHGCPLACGKNVKAKEGMFAGKSVKMPEYETIYAIGSMLDNADMNSIINGNHLCDLMGLDTISMGVTLSFVAECIERGIISEADFGGAVNFADGPGMVELIGKTARKEGIGAKLAKGSQRLAREFGGDAYKYLYAVKGLEIAGHSARGLRGMSLSYPTSTRGGSHHDGRPKYVMPESDPGFAPQPEYIQKNQYFTAFGDSMVICRFTAERGFGTMLNDDLARALNYVTGWDISLGEMEQIGERVYNLERMINTARGASRKDDTLPYRVMNEPIPDGPAKGRYCPQEELDTMLDEYYALRGWSPDGVPSDEKLVELGLK